MEGQHVEKKPGGAGKVCLIVGVVVVALAAVYLGLCAWVGASDQIMPNVSIAGLDVSGMTAEQAQTQLEQVLAERGDQMAVTLTYGDWSETVKGSELRLTEDQSGQSAYEVGRGSFLTQGFQYVRRLLGGSAQVEPELSVDEQRFNALLDRADQALGGSVTQAVYQVGESELAMTKGATGVAFEWNQTAQELVRAFQEQVLPQALSGEGGGTAQAVVTLTAAETPPQEPDFDAIYREVYVEPQDAQMDPETYEITGHVVGVSFDVDGLKRAYEAAAEGETFTVPLVLTQPQETKESLESKLFADLLGEATSQVSGNSNRKNNVKLASAACNGVILMPGEVFSYNGTTGRRSAENGYLPAAVYVGGKTVTDYGGGVCQPSSTIYYAVLHTTLEVVERHNHQFAVGYVPDGMDATVSYGSLDFQFKNSTDYPIKIVMESYTSGGKLYLTAKIYGTNADGRYGVPERTQYDWVSPTTTYVADESVARGSLVLDKTQNAYTGRKAQTYRYIYEQDGTLVEKQNMGVSTYKMRPTTYYYNPLDGDPSTWVDGKPAQPTAPGTTEPDAPGTTEPDAPGTTEPDAPGTTEPDASGTPDGGDPAPGTEDQTGGTDAGEPVQGAPASEGAAEPVSPEAEDGQERIAA